MRAPYWTVAARRGNAVDGSGEVCRARPVVTVIEFVSEVGSLYEVRSLS